MLETSCAGCLVPLSQLHWLRRIFNVAPDLTVGQRGCLLQAFTRRPPLAVEVDVSMAAVFRGAAICATLGLLSWASAQGVDLLTCLRWHGLHQDANMYIGVDTAQHALLRGLCRCPSSVMQLDP